VPYAVRTVGTGSLSTHMGGELVNVVLVCLVRVYAGGVRQSIDVEIMRLCEFSRVPGSISYCGAHVLADREICVGFEIASYNYIC
jgi:hypothetical protein